MIFSDSHGKFEPMRRIVLKERPDFVAHLGDGAYDFRRLQAEYPIPMAGIKGNCDIGSDEQLAKLLTLDGVKILFTHGHKYGVKSGIDAAVEAAKKAGAGILMFGHTHRAMYEMSGSLHVLNPGSISEGCYAITEIKDGRIDIRLKNIFE